MSTNKPKSLRDLNKTKTNLNSETDNSKVSVNNVKKSTINKTKLNNSLNKSIKPSNIKTTVVTPKKPTVFSPTKPNKGKQKSTSLSDKSIQNKSKTKIPNTNSTSISNSKSNLNAVKTTNSKSYVKPKSTSTLSTSTKSNTITSSSVKPKTTTDKSKITSPVKQKTLKSRVSSPYSNVKPKVDSNISGSSLSRIKSTSINSITTRKGKTSTTNSTTSKTKLSTSSSSLSSNSKPKTSVRTSRVTSTSNTRLKPSTASSTTSSSSLSTIKKPKTKSNLSTVSTSTQRNHSSITSRKLTSSPTPYSSQNSSSSTITSPTLARRKKPSPYANVKAKVNSLPSKSSKISSVSSNSTIKPKTLSSNSKSTISSSKTLSTSTVTLKKNTNTPSKSNTVSVIKKESSDKPSLIVTSSSIKKEDEGKHIVVEKSSDKTEENVVEDKINKNNEVVTPLSKSLQDLVKNEGVKLNDITPIESPISLSPVVAPCLTKDTDKLNSPSIPPSPISTPKITALQNQTSSKSTNNEILDEYIKNIKYDPNVVKHLDPNTLDFDDNDENVEKAAQSSFIADTKHFDDLSVTTDDFLDCESTFSIDTKSSTLLSPSLNSPTNNENKLVKVSSMSNLSTISSISSITHKSSTNSFTSNVSIHTLKTIFDNAIANQSSRSSPIPPSTPKVNKLNPETLKLFENPSEISTKSKISSPSSKPAWSKSSSTTTSPLSSPTLKYSPLMMKSVKSRFESNSAPISNSSSHSKSGSLSSIGSLNTKSSLTKNKNLLSPPSISNRSSLIKSSSTGAISSLNKRPANKTSTLTKSVSATNSLAKSNIGKSKTPTLSSNNISLTKTPTTSSKPIHISPVIPRRNTRVTSLQPESKSTVASTKSYIPKLVVGSHLVPPPLPPRKSNVNSEPSHEPSLIPPPLPPRKSNVNSENNEPSPEPSPISPALSPIKKQEEEDELLSTINVHASTVEGEPEAEPEKEVVDNEQNDDEEFKDSKDTNLLMDQELSVEPESEDESNSNENKAIPSYTVKKHTLDQSQICEITEDSFILNQYVEDNYYYQTKHSHNEELIGDLIHAEAIIDQIKEEVSNEEKRLSSLQANNEEEEKEEVLEILKTSELQENDFQEPVTSVENEKVNETEGANEDEDGMSLGSISMKKLIKKNITNIIKPKTLSNLIKKKSSMDLNESFESSSTISDNNSEISGISERRDSKGSTSYVFSMFMQSLNGANNLIKKKRNSGNFDDMKITISGPYHGDEDGKSEAESVNTVETSSFAPGKTVVVPLNTSIEIPKRVSSAIPFSDDESQDTSFISTSVKPNKTMPMKLDVSSNIQSTPIELIHRSVERNREKHISGDSGVYLSDSITYDNIKEIINEEWNETISKQKFAVSNIIEENETSIATGNEDRPTLPTSSSSESLIQNNQILRNLSCMDLESLSTVASYESLNEIEDENQALIQKQLKKINNIISEIASTEKTYVNELAKLLEIYYYPMEQNQTLNSTEMNYLYSNIANIYQFHSEIFYPKLSQVQKEHEKNIKLISEGDGLKSPSAIKLINESISIEAFFKIVIWPFQFLYKPYYVNFKKASDFVSILNNTQKQKYSSDDVLVQAEELGFYDQCPIFERANKKKFKKLKSFLKNCQERKDHHQVDILGYLILPIQRLPRYLLLLEGLAKSVKLLEEATSKLAPPEVEKDSTPKEEMKTEGKEEEDHPVQNESPSNDLIKNTTDEASHEKDSSLPDKEENTTNQEKIDSSDGKKESNAISKLKEDLNKSSNETKNNIEAKKASDRTERAKNSQINVKSMIAQIEINNSPKIEPVKTQTNEENVKDSTGESKSETQIETKEEEEKEKKTTSSIPEIKENEDSIDQHSNETNPTTNSESNKNNNNNNNTKSAISSLIKTYTIDMAAKDIKNIIELCNKAIA